MLFRIQLFSIALSSAQQLAVFWTILVFLSRLSLSSPSLNQHHPHQRRHSSPAQQVDLDLKWGIVKGYSPYIRFQHSPTHPKDALCSAQAVLQIDLGGPFNRVRFSLEYENARLWTFHVSDSINAIGYGGRNDANVTSQQGLAAEAEVHIFNRQLRVYGNDLSGYLDAVLDGGLLLKVADNVVTNASRQVAIEVSDEKVEWKKKNVRQSSIESKFLFTLGGQNNSRGENTDYFIYAGFNRVVGGNFRKGNGLCRAIITLHADRVDRCKPPSSNGKTSHQCHPDADCFNTTKSFRCRCKEGFYGNGRLCVDTNECEYENGGCVHVCTNIKGSHKCSCKDGFILAQDGRDCIDKDECKLNNGGCEHTCKNTMGHFQCLCRDGYHLAQDGRSCLEGRNWCLEDHGCPFQCERSLSGVVRCACRPGMKMAGVSGSRKCVATCSYHNGGCQHRCTDTPHGPLCTCHNKYTLRDDAVSCTATCGVNNGGCDRLCENTVHGPKCSCPPGYKLNRDGKTCDDVDECSDNIGGCSFGCLNTRGSYECVCPKGYKVNDDKTSCQDIDECSSSDTCDHICTNTLGSFHCSCSQGYELYGGTHCADKNECSMSNGGCEHTCENTEGSFLCGCHAGYRLHSNMKDCVESVKCSTLRFPAKVTAKCSSIGQEEVCRLSCTMGSQFTTQVEHTFTIRCSPNTNFRWSHELQNLTLPSCSEHVLAPGFKGKGKFMLLADQCRMAKKRNFHEFEKQLNSIVTGSKSNACEDDLCSVTFLDLKCDHRKRKFRHLNNNKRTVMSAEFELEIKPAAPTSDCSLECTRQEMQKKMRQSFKRLRREMNTDLRFRYDGKPYEVMKKSLRSYKMRDICVQGQVLVNKKCVMCSLATYYNNATAKCEACPPGTYQDEEGQLNCKPCKDSQNGVSGAKSVLECGEACAPGSYSENGLKPCRSCPIGTYQPDYARTLCLSCGPGILTSSVAATGFNDCIVPERCRAGYFFIKEENRCIPCSPDTYQPAEGQNFCIDCPGDTQTDKEGANSSAECKERKCGGVIGHLQGFIQSPNWPGVYPSNVECTWKITPDKGRRILVVIPEIHLVAGDKCRDFLVMRKTASPYSLTTFETCDSSDTPVAFTARSKSLWIYFRTDADNNARGFSIPYVTYNEDYQELIEEIVRDGRLYSSYQHQEVLKNRKLLSSLMEVIANPYSYFKYANSTQSLFPESFIKLLKNKVMKFFS